MEILSSLLCIQYINKSSDIELKVRVALMFPFCAIKVASYTIELLSQKYYDSIICVLLNNAIFLSNQVTNK